MPSKVAFDLFVDLFERRWMVGIVEGACLTPRFNISVRSVVSNVQTILNREAEEKGLSLLAISSMLLLHLPPRSHLWRADIFPSAPNPSRFHLAGCIDTPVPGALNKLLEVKDRWHSFWEIFESLCLSGLDVGDLRVR